MHCLNVVVSVMIIWSCNNDGSTIKLNKDTSVSSTIDSSQKQTDLTDSLHHKTSVVETTVNRNFTPVDTTLKIRLGKHNFTLQWIGWDHPGTVNIEPSEDGWYNIEGRQDSRTGTDYITIQGGIKPVTDKKLLFRGFVEHRVETLNGGKPCRKEGEQVFLSTKGRKYWRMQDMQNCEGGMVTDYVDIYF